MPSLTIETASKTVITPLPYIDKKASENKSTLQRILATIVEIFATIGQQIQRCLMGCLPHIKSAKSESTITDLKAQKLRYEEYLALLKQYPTTLGPMGTSKDGEIEIIQDTTKMAEIEKSFGRKIGIVARDKYWMWINDAVLFPNNKPGVYGRILWLNTLKGPAGAIVAPVLPDGRIVLNLNYRHATRSWEFELPRGASSKGETIEQTATREAKEETGLDLSQLRLLGNVTPDTGLTNTVAQVFMAKVTSKGKATPEYSEAIADIKAFTLSELKEGFKKGYLPHMKNGKEERIPLRDPFLAYALLQMIA